MEGDVTRTRITVEELESRRWHFNFTPEAGGRGAATLRTCSFRGDSMCVPGFPPLRFRLVDSERRQWLFVNNFPPHTVERRAADGEWIIKNENITCVSCHETEAPTYRDRGFQG